jgi:predicted phage terminase large subunit-like protein
MEWSVVYERAIREDGSLLFPERLTQEFLDQQRRELGSYFFANQYQNEIIPEDEKRFKAAWLRYYKEIPENTYRFAFIDPALGQKDHHDFTGIAVVECDPNKDWYLRLAKRTRLTPTGIVEYLFQLQRELPCQAIGIEIVAYQEALLYMLEEEGRRRGINLPVKGIRRGLQTKESRILSLVPRFEFGRIFVAQGMTDFEDEYNTFPRGKFDDILDAVASLEELVYYPERKEKKLEKPASPAHPDYERWNLAQLIEKAGTGSD